LVVKSGKNSIISGPLPLEAILSDRGLAHEYFPFGKKQALNYGKPHGQFGEVDGME
jgi:hypothetical protein